MTTRRPAVSLFAAGACRAVELGGDDLPVLQRFFEANPDYFLAVTGAPPSPGAAHEEAHGTPPQDWTYTRKWLIGFVDETDSLIGMADVITDLLAPGVWHIGLLIVATRLHGTGVAQALYGHLERWMRDSGARWLRLGVVEGNTRAEHFWDRNAYVEVRKRVGIEMGSRVNTVRVMMKALRGGTVREYLASVARDRADAC